MEEVQWHDVGAAALQVHVFVADSGLVPAPVSVLNDELQLWQSLVGCWWAAHTALVD